MKRGAWLARLSVGAALAAGASASFGACGTQESHVFVGRQYDPRVKCLGEDISIDVVAGEQPPNPCAPLCITSTFDEAGTLEVYVSSMCAPFPNYPWVLVRDASATPECVAALSAWAYDTTCEDGGGVINVPEAGNDAGSDSGSDAQTDTGIDAAGDATAD